MDSPPHPDESSSTTTTAPTTATTPTTTTVPQPPQRAHLWAELWAQLWPAVWSQLRADLLPWLRPGTWSQVWHEVWPVEKSPAYLRRALPRMLPVLLLVVLVTSLISMLAFVAYIILGVLPGNEGSTPVIGLYAIGLFGLLVATVCQVLGVGILICLWALRVDAEKKPRELAVLVVSLIPYLSVVVFLATLVIYVRVWERSDDPLSERVRELAGKLRERSLDTFVNVGTNTTSAASSPPPPAVTPSPTLPPATATPVPGPTVPPATPVAPGTPAISPTPATPASAAPASPVAPATPAMSNSPGVQTVASPAASSSATRPRLQDVVRRVVGPVTEQSLSMATNGLVGLTMVALFLLTILTLGVVVPANWFAPLQGESAYTYGTSSGGGSGYGTSSGGGGYGVACTTNDCGGGTPVSTPLTGRWTFTFTNLTVTCSAADACSSANQANLPPTVLSITQTGANLVLTFPGTASSLQPGGPCGVNISSLQGYFSDNTAAFNYAFTGPCTDASGATGTVTDMMNMTGFGDAPDSMSGRYIADASWTVNLNGQPTTYTMHQEAKWTATRNK